MNPLASHIRQTDWALIAARSCGLLSRSAGSFYKTARGCACCPGAPHAHRVSGPSSFHRMTVAARRDGGGGYSENRNQLGALCVPNELCAVVVPDAVGISRSCAY